MSAIAGWVDYRRNLTYQDSIVRTMAGSMANRGPDDERIWVSEDCVLGHRLLDIEVSTRQPVVLNRGVSPAVVGAHTGHVTNASELRKELLSRGHRLGGDGVTEVLLAAYLEWGGGCAERIEGTFALAVWDIDARTLTLVRDRIGTRPLYYASTPTGVVFASERKALLTHPQVASVVDATGLRELFSLAATPGDAILRGIKQVPAGHIAEITPDGTTLRRYWRLGGAEHTDDVDTTVETIRSLLEHSVRDNLTTDLPIGTLLSGGLDSSTVTSLAAKQLGELGMAPPQVFTVGFARQQEQFTPDKTWETLDDPFVRDVARHIGVAPTVVTLDTDDLMDPLARLATLYAKDLPSPLGNMNTSLYLLCRQVREFGPVALHGDPSDAVFGGFPWVFEPSIMSADTLPWVARAHAAGGRVGFGADLLDVDLLKRLDLAGYAADAYHTALADVPHVDGETGLDRKMREISYLHLTRWLEVLLGQSETMSASVGLELRWPYASHQLVEYAFNVPWAMKDADERGKGLLRAAARDLLPRSVLDRKKSPFPVTRNPAYGQALCAELAALLADPTAPVTPLINVAAATELIADPSRLAGGSTAFAARSNVEMVLQLNVWLTRYRVTVEV